MKKLLHVDKDQKEIEERQNKKIKLKKQMERFVCILILSASVAIMGFLGGLQPNGDMHINFILMCLIGTFSLFIIIGKLNLIDKKYDEYDFYEIYFKDGETIVKVGKETEEWEEEKFKIIKTGKNSFLVKNLQNNKEEKIRFEDQKEYKKVDDILLEKSEKEFWDKEEVSKINNKQKKEFSKI